MYVCIWNIFASEELVERANYTTKWGKIFREIEGEADNHVAIA